MERYGGGNVSLRVLLRGPDVDDEVMLVEGQVEDLVSAHLANNGGGAASINTERLGPSRGKRSKCE